MLFSSSMCSLKICCPLFSQEREKVQKSQTKKSFGKICDLYTAGGATAVEASKDMKYLADNFQDNRQGCWTFSNCKGQIFQVVRAQFFSAN